MYASTDEEGWENTLEIVPDLVAIAGGDGAVGKVLRRLAGSSVPATLLPLGTANNIAASLGLSADLDELVGSWTSGQLRRYDLGTITGPDGEGLFVEAVGGGLFADAIARAEDSASGTEDKVELGLRILRGVVADAEPRPWQLRLDAIDESHDLLAVEAMVIGRTGPGIPLAPTADVGDAMLDVVFVGEPERKQLATYVDGRLANASPSPPQLPIRRAKDVELVPPEGTRLRVDDEPLASSGPVRVSTGTHSVEILMP